MRTCVWRPLKLSIVWKQDVGHGQSRAQADHCALTLVERGVEEISSHHPSCWRGGGRDKGLFPNATAEAGASWEEALNWMLAICSAWENYR